MTAPLSVRLRPELQATIARHGSPHTTARALILVGLAHIGVDVRPFERDIALLLAEPLDETLRGALRGLGERTTPVLHPYYAPEPQTTPTSAIAAVDDGFDV